MNLFKSKEQKMLDDVIFRIESNLSNNYKDNAQEAFKEFEKMLNSFSDNNVLNKKQKDKYFLIYEKYQKSLKNYSHKDQKPYWT